jgi:hypothetical protein
VGGGNFQDRTTLYEDVSAPTASLPFIFAVSAIAAQERRHVYTADIPTAYLNADNSSHNITMRLNKIIASELCEVVPDYREYLRNDGSMVVKLERALYGCVESARLWYNTLRKVLEADGYTANAIEPCIFNKVVNDIQCTCVIYVDDLMITCKDKSVIEATLSHLGKAFESDLTIHEGPIVNYLGMRFDFSSPGTVGISMPAYVDDTLLDIAKIKGTASTPAGINLFSVSTESPTLDQLEREDFHSQVARLLYLAKRTRPDILLAVSFLTTRVQEPTLEDLGKLTRTLKYINGTRPLGLNLRHDPSATVHAYVDASYGVHDDYRSHTGMVIALGAGIIDARSTKQKLNTKSSTEAELVALSDMCSKVIWHRDFLIAQGYSPPPARVYQDNQSTMSLISNGKSHSDRTRHIAIRYFWVRDRVNNKEIEVVYCPTEQMVADILTKPIVGEKFIYLRNMLLNWEYTPLN